MSTGGTPTPTPAGSAASCPARSSSSPPPSPAKAAPPPSSPLDGGEADGNPADVSAAGIHGLAGNVREWAGEPSRNPAFPMGEPRIVLLGGSHRAPASGVKTREWTDSRGLRARDLGFRTVSRGEK